MQGVNSPFEFRVWKAINFARVYKLVEPNQNQFTIYTGISHCKFGKFHLCITLITSVTALCLDHIKVLWGNALIMLYQHAKQTIVKTSNDVDKTFGVYFVQHSTSLTLFHKNNCHITLRRKRTLTMFQEKYSRRTYKVATNLRSHLDVT